MRGEEGKAMAVRDEAANAMLLNELLKEPESRRFGEKSSRARQARGNHRSATEAN